jgi:glycerophosphoryl diester phosphodiesterase
VSERPFSQEGASLIIAHRGASIDHPENTLDAFEAAVAAGADAVEFDVRVTSDDHAVVLHDAAVDRTTDGKGLARATSLEAIKRLRISTQAGAPTLMMEIPTLTEALATLSGRVAVDIEIKNLPGEPDFEPDRERAVELVHAALDATAFVGGVIVSSFNPLSVAESRRRRPDIATGLLTDVGVEAEAAVRFAAHEGHRWVLPFIERVRETLDRAPANAHEAGLLLATWLTDDPAVAVALFAGGVDAVATNDPGRIVGVTRRAAGP